MNAAADPAGPESAGALSDAAGEMTDAFEEPTDAVEAAGKDGADTDARDLARTSRQAVWGWRSNIDQFMPVVLFLVFYNLVSTEFAVLAATAWSVPSLSSKR